MTRQQKFKKSKKILKSENIKIFIVVHTLGHIVTISIFVILFYLFRGGGDDCRAAEPQSAPPSLSESSKGLPSNLCRPSSNYGELLVGTIP